MLNEKIKVQEKDGYLIPPSLFTFFHQVIYQQNNIRISLLKSLQKRITTLIYIR